MAIIYDPTKELKKIAPESKIKKLISGNVSLKKTALSFVDSADFIDKKSVSRVALKTIKSYKKRIKASDVDSIEKDIKKDPRLLVARVQNEIVFQISQEIKSKYVGEKYEWLPSDAEEPDPEHQLKYGKIYSVGDGEMPGDRYGCRCGMRILTDDEKLKL